ncbi:MAG: hypothetical protein CVV06_08395 [Gammaproteobacteria bacterium HGW-Gammaproteobacteria-10]|nr:MAG: hypothetical protein CVV06_08395 [Gammaproteobacteria bacterium HGW-Gammaproteobacteria-10]
MDLTNCLKGSNKIVVEYRKDRWLRPVLPHSLFFDDVFLVDSDNLSGIQLSRAKNILIVDQNSAPGARQRTQPLN